MTHADSLNSTNAHLGDLISNHQQGAKEHKQGRQDRAHVEELDNNITHKRNETYYGKHKKRDNNPGDQIPNKHEGNQDKK